MGGRKSSKPPDSPAPSPVAMALPEVEAASDKVRKKARRKGRGANILAGGLMKTRYGKDILG